MTAFEKIVILGYFVLLVSCSNAWECSDIKTSPIPHDIEEQRTDQCFRKILESGNLEQVAKVGSSISEKHEKKWIDALQGEIRRLGLLQRELILGESILQPVIKWGQNISHIFINIKTSHRWDSPPCLNTKTQTVFLNQSLLQYVNICVVSQQKLAFVLRVNLYKLANIVGQKGESGNLLDFKVMKNGVGMYSATFQKLEYEIWPFLNKEETSYAIWPQMAERYSSDHKKYEELTRAIAAKLRKGRTKDQSFAIATISLLILSLLL